MAKQEYAYEQRSGGVFIRRPMPADGKLPEGWVKELPPEFAEKLAKIGKQAEGQ
jgi:hypothetical protein